MSRIPLIISHPGATRGHEVSLPVANLDLAPTLLDLAGLPIPERFEGHSLAAEIATPTGFRRLFHAVLRLLPGQSSRGPVQLQLFPNRANRPVTDLRHQRGVVDGDHKLLISGQDRREGYDLGSDPKESNPDALPAAEKARLEAKLGDSGADPHPAPSIAIDATTRERMRALGYTD